MSTLLRNRNRNQNHSRLVTRAAALAAGSLLSMGLAVAAGAQEAHRPGDIVVTPGQSIQAAIDRAPDHGTVVVRPGVYAENLLITRPVTLAASKATLVVPAQPVWNLCLASPEDRLPGICVLGELTDVQPDTTPTIVRYVEDVRISGLRVTGFPGQGLKAFATERMVLADDEFDNNAATGALSLASHHSVFRGNRAHDNALFGLTVEDAPASAATFVGNDVRDNAGIGILVRDADAATVTDNTVEGNCAGIFVVQVDTDEATGAVVSGNRVRANNRYCPANEDGYPSMAGIGIGVAGGVTDTSVMANSVVGHRATAGTDLPAAGLLLLDLTTLGGGPVNGVQVTGNVLRANAPADLLDVSGGTNVIGANRCTISIPAGSC